MAWYDKILQPFEGMNIFGASVPPSLQKMADFGLLGADSAKELERAKQQSLIKGLLGTAARYFATPKNRNLGTPLPYLFESYVAGGMPAAEGAFKGFEQGALTDIKLQDIKREQEDRNLTETAFQELIANNPDLQNKGLENLPPALKANMVKDYSANLTKEMFSTKEIKPNAERTKTFVDPETKIVFEQKQVFDPVATKKTGVQTWKDLDDPYPKYQQDDVPNTKFDDQTIEMFARSFIIDRKLPAFGRGKTGEENRKGVFDRVSQIVADSGMTFDEFAFNQIANIQEIRDNALSLNRFSSGPQGNTIRSLNVAMHHLQTLDELTDALNNNDVLAVNRIKNYVAKEFGDADITNFNFAKQIVADEIAKAVIGSGAGTGQERLELQEAFKTANSFDQLQGVVKTAKRLMAGQLSGLKDQYIDAVGGNLATRRPFEDKLHPITKKLFKEFDETDLNKEGTTRTIVNTGVTKDGRKVIKYSDGSVEYAPN